MNFLGVCNATTSGATLFVDNHLVASVNEESFSRIKTDNSFPIESIKYCLKVAALTPLQINYVGCGAWGGISQAEMYWVMKRAIEASLEDPDAKEIILKRTETAIRKDEKQKIELIKKLKNIGFSEDLIEFYDHHLSHIYTAFYPSPFEEALVLTMDCRGDFKSATISIANRHSGIEIIDKVTMYDSIGALYGFVTNFLGFTPEKDEGKIMSLAPYGNAEKTAPIFRKMICFKNDRIRAMIGSNYTPFMKGELPFFKEKLSKFKDEDIAAGVQYLAEEIVMSYLKKYLNTTKLRNVCLAGGVFSNVKINQKILALETVDNIYIFPQMGDAGNAFGGALISLYMHGLKFDYPLNNLFLGPAYSSKDIESILSTNKNIIQWQKIDEYSISKIALDLSNGKIIGLFCGNMEYGPRALGNRSILARATDSNTKRILNQSLNREEYMPFSPVTLEEYASLYYKNWQANHIASHFMTVSYNCTKKAKNECPGIVHIDGTARPQIVSEHCHPLYVNILKAYHKLTGIPTLINTSFNRHEEPIVCNPADAIKELVSESIDYLVMEDFAVFRNIN